MPHSGTARSRFFSFLVAGFFSFSPRFQASGGQANALFYPPDDLESLDDALHATAHSDGRQREKLNLEPWGKLYKGRGPLFRHLLLLLLPHTKCHTVILHSTLLHPQYNIDIAYIAHKHIKEKEQWASSNDTPTRWKHQMAFIKSKKAVTRLLLDQQQSNGSLS